MNKELLLKIETIFTNKLQRKTGWGRNEVLILFKEAMNEAILDMVDSIPEANEVCERDIIEEYLGY